MFNVIKELDSLKGKPCQWLFTSGESRIRFNGHIKAIEEDDLFYSVIVKFKGNKPMYVSLNKVLSMKKEENEDMFKLHIFSNNVPVLVVGYLKA